MTTSLLPLVFSCATAVRIHGGECSRCIGGNEYQYDPMMQNTPAPAEHTHAADSNSDDDFFDVNFDEVQSMVAQENEGLQQRIVDSIDVSNQLAPTEVWAILETFLDSSWHRHESALGQGNFKWARSNDGAFVVTSPVAVDTSVEFQAKHGIQSQCEAPLASALDEIAAELDDIRHMNFLIPLAWKIDYNHFTLLSLNFEGGRLNVMHYDPRYSIRGNRHYDPAIESVLEAWAENINERLEKMRFEIRAIKDLLEGLHFVKESDEVNQKIQHWQRELQVKERQERDLRVVNDINFWAPQYVQSKSPSDSYQRFQGVHCGRYVTLAILSYLSADPNLFTRPDLQSIIGEPLLDSFTPDETAKLLTRFFGPIQTSLLKQ